MPTTTYQWQPSTAEVARRAGIRIEDVIRFDHNTSPRSTSWAGAPLAAVASSLNEYPAPDYWPLRHAIGAYTGVQTAEIVPGAGADELISLCARAFLKPGDVAVSLDPTYSLYRVATEQHHGAYLTVAAEQPDFAFPLEPLVAAASAAQLVWLCVPNNPTGERPEDVALKRVIDATAGVVVIDAAYAEFCGDKWAPLIAENDNMVVLHTLSKAFGLAGIRVGYALASPSLAARLEAIRPPGSISTTSAALAIAALSQPAMAAELVEMIAQERDVLARRLRSLGFEVRPSRTNFLLCEVGPEAHRIEAALLAEGLVVRKYPKAPLAEFLRFTVRTRPDHDRLIAALERNLT